MWVPPPPCTQRESPEARWWGGLRAGAQCCLATKWLGPVDPSTSQCLLPRVLSVFLGCSVGSPDAREALLTPQSDRVLPGVLLLLLHYANPGHPRRQRRSLSSSPSPARIEVVGGSAEKKRQPCTSNSFSFRPVEGKGGGKGKPGGCGGFRERGMLQEREPPKGGQILPMPQEHFCVLSAVSYVIPSMSLWEIGIINPSC